MVVPNRSTPIDTKLLVSSNKWEWEFRYFAGMTPQHMPLAWGNGVKSTSPNAKAYQYAYALVAEEPTDEVVPSNLATLEQRIADLVETVGALQRRLDKQLN